MQILNAYELPGQLLTTRHACRHADCSKATLFRAARRGDLHPVRLGRHMTRWPLVDLNEWVARAAVRAEGV
ncbi:MAG: DNA-binding protein [Rhodanobacteraceae bacterium]|nr:MAG: DNA-binding protein [Rhodanobacteraceae bacterium]